MAAESARPDYITHLALSRAAQFHGRHERTEQAHHAPRLPASVIPDLRFEQTYLKKITPHIRLERGVRVKGKEKEGDHVAGEVVSVEWGKVIWITARDQVISPLVQGVLWGTATHFMRPVLMSLSAYLWPAHKPPPPMHEGKAAGWLRHLGRSLSGSVGLSTTPSHR
ncbi:hypothetical protein FA95DRAFT_535022 [Auriscalpium vulgare]|uniref:Uncharacterized protein n=1 Tax=Auriscalpium vulgare TaxID=40419 RepID=A0ACB8RFH1_9AGAM|nr:hypothetical protein FA95DRAFT_535022 [Auriscalpium vulgare]